MALALAVAAFFERRLVASAVEAWQARRARAAEAVVPQAAERAVEEPA
jgi:hypothetical protein